MISPGDVLSCSSLSDEGYKVVAVIGYNSDFAVYQYHTDASDDEIARFGDKISEKQARRLFPELEFLFYRP